MQNLFEKVIAAIVLMLAVGFGGLSMIAFVIFLYAGPLHQIELGLGLWSGIAMNGGLSLVFFVQQSVMVRSWFKQWLVRFVPEHYVGAVYATASGIVLLTGTVLEERDLVAEFGSRYRVYQSNVPMLIPKRFAGWS